MNMEVIKTEDMESLTAKQELRFKEGINRNCCIYFSKAICKLPNLQFQICRKCPRAAKYIQTNVVHSLFDRVKALAISLMDKMGVQAGASK